MSRTRDPEFDRALGRVIRKYRETRKLTQRDPALVKEFGRSPSATQVAMSRIESGAVPVSPARLDQIAQWLNVPRQTLEEEANRILLEEAQAKAEASAASGAGTYSMALRRVMAGASAPRNELRRIAIEQTVANRQEITMRWFSRLQDSQEFLTTRVIDPYLAIGSEISGREFQVDFDQSSSQQDTRESQFKFQRLRLAAEIGNTLGKTAAWGGAGAAAGSGAVAALTTWVAATATASTGVAISGLSGAAATSATLAAIGGGSLAAGGAGMVAGTMILASIVTLPALLAAGSVFAFQRKRLVVKAEEESERLADAERVLRDSEEDLVRVWSWLKRADSALYALTLNGQQHVRWLRDNHQGPVQWSEVLSTNFEQQLLKLEEIVIAATSILTLPILRDLDPEAANDGLQEERAAWIDMVLDYADRLSSQPVQTSE